MAGVEQGIDRRLSSLMNRFPRGLNLSREDMALIGWLYLYEQERGAQGIPDSEIKWLISEAVRYLSLDDQAMQPTQTIQRLMRFNILRVSITDARRRGYRLTCLGQSLAGNLMDEIDYGSEQLNVLLSFSLRAVKTAGTESDGALLGYLKHVFLATLRESIEYRLLAMEEDLQERKKEVRRTYSEHNQADLEKAIRDIEYCRMALTELVDAVQESSACVALEEQLHEHMGLKPTGELWTVLEQSLNFIYILRSQVDAMLKDVVQFIHDCIVYRSLALTVDSRERLGRIQEEILSYALEHVVCMPVLDPSRLPHLDLNWSKQEQERPVIVDRNRLRTIEDFCPPELPPAEPEWKASFLKLARNQWGDLAKKGEVDLADWLNVLTERLPQINEALALAVWFLTQDWPGWVPPVSARHRRGIWVPLGKEWLMESVLLVPV